MLLVCSAQHSCTLPWLDTSVSQVCGLCDSPAPVVCGLCLRPARLDGILVTAWPAPILSQPRICACVLPCACLCLRCLHRRQDHLIWNHHGRHCSVEGLERE